MRGFESVWGASFNNLYGKSIAQLGLTLLCVFFFILVVRHIIQVGSFGQFSSFSMSPMKQQSLRSLVLHGLWFFMLCFLHLYLNKVSDPIFHISLVLSHGVLLGVLVWCPLSDFMSRILLCFVYDFWFLSSSMIFASKRTLNLNLSMDWGRPSKIHRK